MLEGQVHSVAGGTLGGGKIEEPRLQQLYEYWLQRKGVRRFPSRREIDPLDISYILGHVMLVDVLGEPHRFRMRLHGTGMIIQVRYDLTGGFLDEPPMTEYRSHIIDQCTSLVDSGEPAVTHDRITLENNQSRRHEALWLPYSENGQSVTMVLCAMLYKRD